MFAYNKTKNKQKNNFKSALYMILNNHAKLYGDWSETDTVIVMKLNNSVNLCSVP